MNKYILYLHETVDVLFSVLAHRSCRCCLLVVIHCFTVVEPPGAPRNLKTTEVTTDTVSLSWEAPVSDGTNDVTQYTVDVRDDQDLDYVPVARLDGRITSYTVECLRCGRLYRFRVRAKNAAGFSETSAELDKPVELKAPIGMMHENHCD